MATCAVDSYYTTVINSHGHTSCGNSNHPDCPTGYHEVGVTGCGYSCSINSGTAPGICSKCQPTEPTMATTINTMMKTPTMTSHQIHSQMDMMEQWMLRQTVTAACPYIPPQPSRSQTTVQNNP